jgi:hypothetical protein
VAVIVRPGDVLKLFFQTTTPPKWKRCVVVSLEPKPLLLLINTSINPFVANTPELMACQVLIDSAGHPFMRSESWIDCSQPFGYPDGYIEAALDADPRQRLGRISEVVRRDIVNCVHNTPLLSERKKLVILEAFDPPPAATSASEARPAAKREKR